MRELPHGDIKQASSYLLPKESDHWNTPCMPKAALVVFDLQVSLNFSLKLLLSAGNNNLHELPGHTLAI